MSCEFSVKSVPNTALTCTTVTTIDSDEQRSVNMSLNQAIHLYFDAAERMDEFLLSRGKNTNEERANLDESSITYELEHLHESEEALRRELDGIHWEYDDELGSDQIEGRSTPTLEFPSTRSQQDHPEQSDFPRMFDDQMTIVENELKHQISDEAYQGLQDELEAVLASVHNDDDVSDFQDLEMGKLDLTAKEEEEDETGLMRLAALLFGSKPLARRARLSWQVLVAILLSIGVFFKQMRDNNCEFQPKSLVVVALPIIAALRERRWDR